MPQPHPSPRAAAAQRPDRTPPSAARSQMESHAAHAGLTTRAPHESGTGRWQAQWWNPARTIRDYDDEDELIADLRRLFGPPEGDPEPEPPPAATRPDPCGGYQPAAAAAGPCGECGWHRNAHDRATA